MYKVLAVTMALIGMTQAANTCKMKITLYSDSSCNNLELGFAGFSNGVANYDMTFGGDECYTPTGQSISHKVVMCSPENLVVLQNFDDNACTNKPADFAPATGFIPNVCYNYNANTYMKVTDVSLEGNRYGFGYLDGWGIFMCQVWLFGLCNGY